MQTTANAITPRTAIELELEEMLQDARNHRAIHHPWLATLACGASPHPRRDLQEFAGSYAEYSRRFPQFLSAVIRQLSEPRHRALLAENLREESGRLDDEMREELDAAGIDVQDIDGVSHPELFDRFHQAVHGSQASETARLAGESWAKALLSYLETASPAAAVGALGLGTESIVRDVYVQILAGLDRLGWPSQTERVFFDLHCLVDDQHQADLLEVAADLAAAPGGALQLRAGMQHALHLRERYFDTLQRCTQRAAPRHTAVFLQERSA